MRSDFDKTYPPLWFVRLVVAGFAALVVVFGLLLLLFGLWMVCIVVSWILNGVH